MNESNGFSPWTDAASFQHLYQRLRIIARSRMAGNGGHTLTPTGLVNEAMVKLLDGSNAQFSDDAHFVATASTAMRHILVDHARRKTAVKRTNDNPVATETDLWIEYRLQLSAEATLDVARELERLSSTEPELVRVIELRVFGGLTFSEIGALLNIETKTAERRWRYASALLRSKLEPA